MTSRSEISVWIKKLLLKNLDLAVQIISRCSPSRSCILSTSWKPEAGKNSFKHRVLNRFSLYFSSDLSARFWVAALPTTLCFSTEELYTMLYQTAEMQSLHKSLEEECVKDKLEGGRPFSSLFQVTAAHEIVCWNGNITHHESSLNIPLFITLIDE